MKKSTGNVLFVLFLAIPLSVNLWKLIGRHYTLFELWPHLLLDVSIMALFLFMIVKNPLDMPVIYWALVALFSISYLVHNPPQGIVEWLATLVVLGAFGALAPRLALLLPWVLLGLMISYYGVLRTYLPELNRDEVIEVLAKKSPTETAREFIRTVLGYDRNIIGREKYRYFLDSGDGFVERLRSGGRLHAAIRPALEREGILYVEWPELRVSGVEDVVFPEAIVPCRLIATDASGQHLTGRAHIDSFTVSTKKMLDGTYRVVRFPESLGIRQVK